MAVAVCIWLNGIYLNQLKVVHKCRLLYFDPYCFVHLITACPQQGPNLMGFANGRQNENFKISLKSPNTLKNTTPPTTASSGGHGMPGGSGAGSSGNSLINAASLGLSPAVSILPNVTSTNPKTPSPSTHEVIRTRALPEKVSI